MKKLTLLTAFLSLGLIGCSQKSSELCECHELQLKMAKEFNELDGDLEAMKAINDKNEKEIKACTAIVGKMKADMKDLSPEEKEKKKQEYINECPAFEELMEMKKK